MSIDDSAFPHIERQSGFTKREYATLMLMQGMLANTGIPSDAGRLAMIKAAAALASEAIEFTAREVTE